MPPAQTNQIRTFKRLAVGAVLIIPLLIVFFWAAGRGYVEITVSGGQDGELAYTLGDQEATSSEKTFKVAVGSGTHELTIDQGSSHYFSAVKSGGFFSTTKVDARLETEKGRRFVGNAPQNCRHEMGDMLVSYECRGQLVSLRAHLPAKAGSPTYTKTISTARTEDVIEGLANTKDGTLIMIQTAVEVDHPDPAHVIYVLGKDLSLSKSTSLSDLRPNESYKIRSFRDGFMVYNDGLSHFLYYPSLGAPVQNLSFPGSSDSSLTSYTLTQRGNTFAVAYTNGIIADDIKNSTSEQERRKIGAGAGSEVVVQSGETYYQYAFGDTYASVTLCAENRLCMLRDSILEVYAIDKENKELLFRMNGIESLESVGNFTLAVRNGRIINLDTSSDSPKGSVQFSLGPYNTCGILPWGQSYALCLGDSSGANTVLYVDQSQESDDIDKKVERLAASTATDSVSAYGRFIFVAVNAGKRIQDAKTGRFVRDPVRVKAARKAVSEEIRVLGIDQKKYSISVIQ